MATRFFDRMARLVRADAHGVLDALEERSLLLRQHVREAELEILQKRARIAALEAEEARLAEEMRRRGEEIRALDEDIGLALQGDKEELARFAIARLLPRRREAIALERRIVEVRDAREKLAERLSAQEEQFESLRSRARAQLAAAREPSGLGDELGEPAVADEEVELELLRRRRGEVG